MPLSTSLLWCVVVALSAWVAYLSTRIDRIEQEQAALAEQTGLHVIQIAELQGH